MEVAAELDSGGVTLPDMAARAPITFPASSELADLLAEIVAGVAGGSKVACRKRVGDVERLPAWRHVTHNWRVTPTGTAEQREVIERAAQIVRAEHSYVV